MIIDEPSKQYPPEKVHHAADAATLQAYQNIDGPGPKAPEFMVWGADVEDGPAPPAYDDSVAGASPSQSNFSFNERWEGSSTSSYSGPSRAGSVLSQSASMRGAGYGVAGLQRNGTVLSTVSSVSSSSSLQRNGTVLSTVSSQSSSSSSSQLPQFDVYGRPINTAYVSAAYAPPAPPTQELSDVASIAGTVDSGSTRVALRHFTPSANLESFLNPAAPPPPFLRTPRPGLSYEPFRPTALMGKSSTLEKGFPALPPPTLAHPHPFGTHDVTEQDWARFLVDLKAVTAAFPVNKLISVAGPTVRNMHMPLGVLSPISFMVNMGLDAHVKSRKKGPVGEFMDLWNQHYFNPRRMQVSLCQGIHVYSGPDTDPADMAKGDGSGHVETYQDDTDSEDEPGAVSRAVSSAGKAVNVALDKRAQWKQAEREKKMRRRQHGSKTPKWRLVVAPKQYVLFD